MVETHLAEEARMLLTRFVPSGRDRPLCGTSPDKGCSIANRFERCHIRAARNAERVAYFSGENPELVHHVRQLPAKLLAHSSVFGQDRSVKGLQLSKARTVRTLDGVGGRCVSDHCDGSILPQLRSTGEDVDSHPFLGLPIESLARGLLSSKKCKRRDIPHGPSRMRVSLGLCYQLDEWECFTPHLDIRSVWFASVAWLTAQLKRANRTRFRNSPFDIFERIARWNWNTR